MPSSAPVSEATEIEIPVNQIIQADCLEFMRTLPDKCIDLVMTSPPYESARTYGIGFSLAGQEWVDWAMPRYVECVRICRGLVCWVIEGRTKKFQWTATPAMLMADLHRAGVKLRKPPIYRRVGIPGSGGPDWLRNDYEFCVCASHGRLPWAANTEMGSPCKYPPGGDPSHRTENGDRVQGGYNPPAIANPGNIIHCKVGGGAMGSPLAHKNEAPYPEALPEFFIRSFCPVGGIVFDPFSGSGTTASVAFQFRRRYLACDIRQSEVELSRHRLRETQSRFDFAAEPLGKGA